MIMSYKQAAQSFLEMVVSGKIAEAYATYIHPDFRHHNAYYPGDAASLQKGMEDNQLQYPDKIFEIKHILEDGDLVAVHSHMRFKESDPGIAVLHLFRFQDDKIIEMWDVGQQIPADSPNENGMF